ncbi:DUF4180 domain-containing protein [Microtetraspora malaysiensis]|uniref:DUF4180 domain-containing protein n=1 Tax=Microtetraspora malaysiensis TaxID=161358 RepID=UPI003D90AADA
MTDTLRDFDGTAVLMCAANGDPLREERDAIDVIGEAMYLGVAWVAVPVERLHDDFFRLRTRVAGDFLQKFVNYRLGVAVVGDVSPYTEASTALRDFVRESNRGTHVWFVPDTEALRLRLTRA